jgi:dephospho-CoA kinase
MKILGITGTSGAGKTTLSKILNEREDTVIIDCDKVVREMSIPGTTYLNAIKDTFGNDILLEDGNLNRKLLASKIYNDNSSREKLNELTFNYVVKEIKNRISNIENNNIEIVVIDAPLLFESGLESCCDYVISLIADEQLKIRRICNRDNIDVETAKSRLSIQNDDEYYISKSDYVIKNHENCDLKSEIEKILGEIRRKNEGFRL